MSKKIESAERAADSVRRMVRRFVCGQCAASYRHTMQHTQEYGTILDGRLVRLIRTASTRPRICSDCGHPFRDGWRDISPTAHE